MLNPEWSEATLTRPLSIGCQRSTVPLWWPSILESEASSDGNRGTLLRCWYGLVRVTSGFPERLIGKWFDPLIRSSSRADSADDRTKCLIE